MRLRIYLSSRIYCLHACMSNDRSSGVSRTNNDAMVTMGEVRSEAEFALHPQPYFLGAYGTSMADLLLCDSHYSIPPPNQLSSRRAQVRSQATARCSEHQHSHAAACKLGPKQSAHAKRNAGCRTRRLRIACTPFCKTQGAVAQVGASVLPAKSATSLSQLAYTKTPVAYVHTALQL